MVTSSSATKTPRSRAAKKPSHSSEKPKAGKTKPLEIPKERVTTTVRLEPGLHAELAALSELEHASFNQIVETATRQYVAARRDSIEQQLERALAALRARPARKGDFDAAIARLVKAEASLGSDDPIEGRMTLLIDANSLPDIADSDLAAQVQSLMTAG